MLETIITNVVGPAVLAAATAFSAYKWGRKKTKEERNKESTENTTLVVDLVNKQLVLVYDRVFKLEKEVTELRVTLSEREEALEDKRTIIKAAYECQCCSVVTCPVLAKQKEIDVINKKIKMDSLNKLEDETITKKNSSES